MVRRDLPKIHYQNKGGLCEHTNGGPVSLIRMLTQIACDFKLWASIKGAPSSHEGGRIKDQGVTNHV